MDSTNTVVPILAAAVTICSYLWFHKKLTLSPTPTSTQPTRVTVRVRGIPLDWGVLELQSFLARDSPDSWLTIGSLAPEINGRSCTATVAFPAGRSWKVPPLVPGSGLSNTQITLDDRFLGITPLFTPSEDHHKVDIIAISGLGGHAFGSFKQRGGEHMWLRDALPHAITGEDGKTPYARVMIYGYESGLLDGQNTQNIEDLAISFHDSLLSLVTATATAKPIIFIAHSLGGLIVKQALINLSKSTGDDHQRLLGAVYGIVFFGVPHDGMDITSLVPMVENGRNRFLLESMGNISSQVLTIQQREFPHALGTEDKSEVVCFFETRESPTVVEIKGKWQMKGPPAVLVSKSSATHCRPWENGPDHICPINRTHSEMVKFGPHDHEYDKALTRIRGVARRALVIRHPTLSASAQRCLRSLGFPEVDARFHDINPATQGTCEWLLEHATYKSWASSSRGLLWIRGKPGSGKSTLLKHALRNTMKTTEPLNRALVLSFFFHGRGTAELQKTPLGLYRSLLHQILRQVPDVLGRFVDSFDRRLQEKGEPGKEWEWHQNELWDVLESSLPVVLQTRPVWLFIDALDEAGSENACHILQKVKSLIVGGVGTVEGMPSTPRPFRLCFSCRDYPVLEEDFKVFIKPTANNQNDISTYVQSRLAASKLSQTEIPTSIAERADGIFMWARVVVDRALDLFRGGKSLSSIEKMVETTPPELVDLYRMLLKDIKTDERLASLKLIQWTCCSLEPLSLDELRWAMIVDADIRGSHNSLEKYREEEDFTHDNDAMERKVTTLSRGLVQVALSYDTRVVQFIHQSAKDFFVEEGLRLLTSAVTDASATDAIGVAHYQLSRTCIGYLAMEEIGRAMETCLDPNTLRIGFPLLRYATVSWTEHAKQSEKKGVSQDDLLDYFGWTSNHLLDRWVNLKRIVGSLLTAGGLDGRGLTMIHVASRYELMGLLRTILEKSRQVNVGINAVDEHHRTPLWWAAQEGRVAAMRVLLDHGADTEARDNQGLTPLLRAARGGTELAIRVLLDHQADIEARDARGLTPLSWAATSTERGSEAAIQVLLDHGADIEARDNQGLTPLMWALIMWPVREAAIRVLLDHGADIEARDNKGLTPLSRAIIMWPGGEAAIRVLLDHGADIEARDNEGLTPLSRAARNGDEAAVQALQRARGHQIT